MPRIRIVNVWARVFYVFAAYVALWLVDWALLAVFPDKAAVVLSWVASLAAVAFGARVFRGAGESVEPPRAWWRMTARPRAGFVIAAAHFLLLGVAAMQASGKNGGGVLALEAIVNFVGFSVLGAAYLHSSIRLLREPIPPRPPKPLKFGASVRVR
jgi:hypothetical protein